jgi:AcrR family transcriptional regulator
LRSDARRNYDAVVTAARAAFAKNGVSASLDDIAKSAGVGPGTLYRHFPNREDLLAAALVDNMRAVSDMGEHLLGEDDPLDALRQWIRDLAHQVGTYGGLPDAVLAAAGKTATALGTDCDAMTQITAALLARAHASGGVRPEVTAEDLFVLINAFAWAADRRKHSVGETDQLFDILMRGITV